MDMQEKDELCKFDCGNIAKFKLKSGVGCCSEFHSQCPKQKEKNSAALSGRMPSQKALKMAHEATRGKISWAKGLTKDTDERIRKISNSLKEKIKSGEIVIKGHPVSDVTKRRLSEVARGRKFGGYQPRSGRGSKGWYKGFWCDSSWELAYVIYNLDHGIEFRRNTEKFDYEHQGVIKKWIPDFIEKEGYVEIKGYKTEQVDAKIKDFKEPLKLLMKDDLKDIFKYVVEKYGRDFIKLYEGYVAPIVEKKIPKERVKKERVKKEKIRKKCISCGLDRSKNSASGKCSKCIDRKIVKNRPSKEILMGEVKESGYSAIGRKYGVSDNAIRKWLK